jgi:hypothetical protein
VKDQKEPLPNASETPDPARSPTASEVLDRIEIPPETMARIAELLSPGASLIVSDQGISHETGQGTDFVVLMPGDKPQQGAKALKTARRHAPRLYYARGFSRPHYARGFFGWGFPW